MGKFTFLLAVLFLYTQPSYGCTCLEIPFKEAIDYEEIFLGRVVKIEEKRELFSSDFDRYWVTHLDVSEKWKGSRKTRIRVMQTFNSCEFPFEYGKEYLVYASKTNRFAWNGTRNFTTWLCSRTIDTNYFYDTTRASDEGWTWDDRDALNNEFPDQVQISSFYNNLRIWIAMLFVMAGFALFKIWNRKRNAL